MSPSVSTVWGVSGTQLIERSVLIFSSPIGGGGGFLIGEAAPASQSRC